MRARLQARGGLGSVAVGTIDAAAAQRGAVSAVARGASKRPARRLIPAHTPRSQKPGNTTRSPGSRSAPPMPSGVCSSSSRP